MAEFNIRVAGSAIAELSEKLPSNIIALNELIKNSYDAGSKSVYVKLDTINRKMTISDSGSGMDDNDIATLLQISRSTKHYGQFVNGRYVQGSKGLGFLSVFKFGDVVTWTTVKDKVRIFTIDYKELLRQENVTDFVVDIIEPKSSTLQNGTIIDITLRESYGILRLKDYLLDEVNRDKILNSFLDKGFIITLDIDGNKYVTNNKISLFNYYKGRQLFHVTYDSEDNILRIEYLNHVKYGSTKTPTTELIYSLKKPLRYKLMIDLLLFDLTGGKSKTRIDKLFIDPTNELTEKLTPLIYINKNLFNNFTLFDPDITRYKRANESIPQIIGYVEIISEDHDLQFNSDRTQFQENELTDEIKGTLADLNLFIQKNASEIKWNIKKENDRMNSGSTSNPDGANAPDDVVPPNMGANTTQNSGSCNTAGGGYIKHEADLRLTQSELIITLPIDSIILSKYIEAVIDNKGSEVGFDVVTYEINNKAINGGVINFTEPGEENIAFIYNDLVDGPIIKYLKIIVLKSPLNTKKPDKILIPNVAKAGYMLDFKQNPLTDLVDQLNRLYKYTRISYVEVIACCLRSLFELAIFELEISGQVEFELPPRVTDRLSEKVCILKDNIVNNDIMLGAVHNGLGLPSFQDFKNMLSVKDFKKIIKKCHLGAHKSTNSLSEDDLEEIGKDAALFLVVANEVLNNKLIDWSRLGHPWHIKNISA